MSSRPRGSTGHPFRSLICPSGYTAKGSTVALLRGDYSGTLQHDPTVSGVRSIGVNHAYGQATAIVLTSE